MKSLRAIPRRLTEDDFKKKIVLHNKQSVAMGLVGDLHYAQWMKVLDEFGNRCAYSFSFETTIDHFIPQAIGHGGTYLGNVYPVDQSLNSSKGDSNPFVWAEQNKDKIEPEIFRETVAYLAGQNNLTVEEFKDFVFYCFQYPRTPEDIKRDPRPSLELWQEHRYKTKRRKTVLEYLAKPFHLDNELFEEFVLWCANNEAPVTEDALSDYFAYLKSAFFSQLETKEAPTPTPQDLPRKD